MPYYIRLRGQEDGPFEIEDLKRLRAQGRFSTIHEVSADRRTWRRASALAEVFSPSTVGSTYQGTVAAPVTVPARITAPPPARRPSAPVQAPTSAAPVQAPTSAAPAPPSDEWHYAHGGQNFGPFRADVLRGLLQSGQLPPDVHVWTPALGSWKPAEQVPQFAQALRGRKRRRTFKIGRLIWALMAAAAVLVAISGLVWALKPDKTNPAVVHGPDDEEGLHAAVGRVFVGLSTSLGDELVLASGSGFNVSKEGHFITNNHVVSYDFSEVDADVARALIGWIQSKKAAGADISLGIWVFFGREEMYHATVLKKFEKSDEPDLAILKLDRPVKRYFRLNAHKDAHSNAAVWTCGFPGIAQAAQSDAEAVFSRALRVSGKSIATQYSDKEFAYSLYEGRVGRSYAEPPLGRYYKVEHNAQMAHGNSGGPLLDGEGKVVGINTYNLSEGRGDAYNISLSVGSLRSFIEQAGIFAEWVE